MKKLKVGMKVRIKKGESNSSIEFHNRIGIIQRIYTENDSSEVHVDGKECYGGCWNYELTPIIDFEKNIKVIKKEIKRCSNV